MNKCAGYQAAVDRLAYEMWVRIDDIHTDVLSTGDESRWLALDEEGSHDPKYGDDFLALDSIMWQIHTTYNVSLNEIARDLDLSQQEIIKQLLLKQHEELWDDV